ncbi:hypothetical protein CYLTODRAFT_459720 [Cylindrobasidium torrendii FP15055 ss-10]|uniref:DUF7918 domain-containing protein n=1 Tax=Cylindrobasidium torrendii FP15055 ss-10 TaxID=1314674 RepID=A0A0D7AUD7_9AGAR|nr:hypothetical protein CYLTODRAFT_459720 [Cylindrobasidium torrendii FP15055 ss-10]
MVHFNEISAFVSVDGQHLPEYAEEYDEDADKLTVWIPSEAGKEFTVSLTHLNTPYDTSTSFYLDGTWAAGKILYTARGRPGTVPPHETCVCSGVTTSATSEKPLLFAELELTDDDEVLNSGVSSELGEIRVEHWHVIVGDDIPYARSKFKETHQVHERSKKAVSHRAGLGAEKPVKYRPCLSTTNVVKLLTIVFRYRPLSMLQANGLAPRSLRRVNDPATGSGSHGGAHPKRKREEQEIIVISSDEEDDDDLKKLEAKLERLRNKKRKIVKADPDVAVKTEPGKVVEVIDLSDD